MESSFTEPDGEHYATGSGVVPGVIETDSGPQVTGADLVTSVAEAGDDAHAAEAHVAQLGSPADTAIDFADTRVALSASLADTGPIPTVTEVGPGAASGTTEPVAVQGATEADLIPHQGAAPKSETGTSGAQARAADADVAKPGATGTPSASASTRPTDRTRTTSAPSPPARKRGTARPSASVGKGKTSSSSKAAGNRGTSRSGRAGRQIRAVEPGATPPTATRDAPSPQGNMRKSSSQPEAGKPNRSRTKGARNGQGETGTPARPAGPGKQAPAIDSGTQAPLTESGTQAPLTDPGKQAQPADPGTQTRPAHLDTRAWPTSTDIPSGTAREASVTPVAAVDAPPREREADERETGARRHVSRRALILAAMIGGAGVAAVPLLDLVRSMWPSAEPQLMDVTFSLNTNWLFGGQYQSGSESSYYDDSSFAPVTLPHTVATLSWRYWNPESWEQVWIYRRHFDGGPLVRPHPPGNRIFVDFDGVMVNAMVVVNDTVVANHQGGYLPFSAELTSHVTAGENLLAVVVDARCLPVPPISYGNGPESIDYYQPGGIYRDVSLRLVPQAFLSDMFALPVNVLSPQRQVNVECTVDSALTTHAVGTLLVTLLDGPEPIAAQVATVTFDSPGISTTKLSLTGLGPISPWSPDNPKLYTVQATLAIPGVGSHVLTRQIGFREAAFRPDGFYLNGERLQLFGLDRHQLYPYAGMAMPARVQRKDVEILKNDFNCNMVRCSHYPQSPHFLDACDELGLLVWEEAPGWHDISENPAWQDLVVQNVRDMVTRDRSRPSVIIWGTRLNETRDIPGLWAATRQAATQLDGSRPSSGAMTHHTEVGWDEDIFAFDDYGHNRVTDVVELRPPLPGVPYIVTEAVGVQETTPRHFTWADPPAQLARQAILHAQAQSQARSDPGYSGMLAWAAFDYFSYQSQDSDGVKWAGVADGFRIPKPGAAMYLSQIDPRIRPVIVPTFFWETEQPEPGSSVPPAQHQAGSQDSWAQHQAGGQHDRIIPPLGGQTTPSSPVALIASNCEQLKVFIGGVYLTTALPASDSPLYRNLPYPPFLVSLPSPSPDEMPELLIEGYVHGQQVTEIRMSSDPTGDGFVMAADDTTIYADGSDATKVVFRAADAYGNQRRYPSGEVTLTLTGPGVLVGDSLFGFGDYGGLGAVWIRSLAGRPGTITLVATHPDLGQAQVQVRSLPASPINQLA